jgi:hypothetical protein
VLKECDVDEITIFCAALLGLYFVVMICSFPSEYFRLGMILFLFNSHLQYIGSVSLCISVKFVDVLCSRPKIEEILCSSDRHLRF